MCYTLVELVVGLTIGVAKARFSLMLKGEVWILQLYDAYIRVYIRIGLAWFGLVFVGAWIGFVGAWFVSAWLCSLPAWFGLVVWLGFLWFCSDSYLRVWFWGSGSIGRNLICLRGT